MYITRTHTYTRTHTRHTRTTLRKTVPQRVLQISPKRCGRQPRRVRVPPIKFARKLFRGRRRRILLFGYYLCRATHVRYF